MRWPPGYLTVGVGVTAAARVAVSVGVGASVTVGEAVADGIVVGVMIVGFVAGGTSTDAAVARL